MTAYRIIKGRKLEKRLVEELQELGFAAERIKEQAGVRSGHADDGVDVNVPLCGVDYTIQCKSWKRGFEPVYRALERAAIACVMMNRREPIVIVPLSVWYEHIRLAESYRAPPISEAAE